MPIDTSSLLRLDPNKSYYLSNTTGEIKEAGVIQWLRCKLGIGGGRTKAAALAERVKSALLAEAAINNDDVLEDQISRLDTKQSISGSRLRSIASRFSIKMEARRRLEEKISIDVNNMAESGGGVARDPEAIDCMKKFFAYAASHIVHDAPFITGENGDVAGYVRRKYSKAFEIVKLAPALDRAAQNVRKACPDFPVVETDGVAAFKLDELHFRIFLLCALDGQGKLDLDHVAGKLAQYPENDIQALREQILAVPLANVLDANAIPDFRNAMDEMFYHNHIVQGAGGARDRDIEITE